MQNNIIKESMINLTEEEAIVYMAEGWDTSQPVTKEQWEHSYYRKAFEKVRQGKWTWNWAAASLRGSWFAFKNIQKYAISFGCLDVLIMIIAILLPVTFGSALLGIMFLIEASICGCSANTIFFACLQKPLSRKPYKTNQRDLRSPYRIAGAVFLFQGYLISFFLLNYIYPNWLGRDICFSFYSVFLILFSIYLGSIVFTISIICENKRSLR